MSINPPIRFSHNHHQLSVKGCEAELDVLAFEGNETLSKPFSYRIEFTSGDHAISKEMMLMKAASLTLQAPVDQGFGIKMQQAVRTLQGVVSRFECLGTSKDETHYGLHLPLLAGTEVAIGFEDGNPDRPYIAGVLHDSAHGDHVTIRNYKRNVLRTPANNKIRLDDERGKEHIKVSTEYGGKSQLNLGHLVDSEKQQRGEGFELRTDSWGAIRAQKGIFISADGQVKAQGEVLEMGAAVSNLGDAREQMTSISGDAQKATANPADLQAQIKLLEQQLTDLKKSVLLLSTPDGMALTSGQHLQVSAGQNLIATAGKNADVSVVKNLFIGVGNVLSVFVRKLGIMLIANQGPVQLQAQNDLMALLARKEISIVSTEDEIKIIAKKKVTINGGGSYITLDANGIESATQGEYRTKAGHYGRKDKANEPKDFPNVAPETTEPSSNFSFS
ncbi:DUF2345 domain-containing protein [Raoultella terrigena]|uniref:DUF2345 domain-containing protein n=1 Tax=Raoultella terrigena TaxID=577 RepID=UPI0015B79FD5|nr:type VI secretion system Vgr family protein [Raoultella terrigena]NWK86984.1 DUF2345 domain-containing protein [Raoultella terrigena]